jgi:hypothetical protein
MSQKVATRSGTTRVRRHVTTGGIAAWQQAANTDQWTETLFRALSARVAKRWRFVSFRGTGGGEWRGVVDIVAIRKDTARPSQKLLKAGDLFDIVLVQMKGGGAPPPNAPAIGRLIAVAKRYHAKAVILFAWKRGEWCRFSRLTARGKWAPSNARDIFG